jgi:hypothetical protein
MFPTGGNLVTVKALNYGPAAISQTSAVSAARRQRNHQPSVEPFGALC